MEEIQNERKTRNLSNFANQVIYVNTWAFLVGLTGAGVGGLVSLCISDKGLGFAKDNILSIFVTIYMRKM